MPEIKKRDIFLRALQSITKPTSVTLDDAASIGSAQNTTSDEVDESYHDPDSNSASSVDATQPVRSSQPDVSLRQIAAIDIAPEQYWDHVYDRLKLDELELMDHYEKILSLNLDDSQATINSHCQDIIGKSRDKRGLQMNRLLHKTLAKMERHSDARGNISVALNVVLSMKSAISSALTAVPLAALAWTPLCLALELSLNHMTQSKSNEDGIAIVISKMKWYSALAPWVHRQDSKIDGQFRDLRAELAEQILTLYQELLKYTVESICASYRHPALSFSRNLIKLDDWDEKLKDIEKIETSIKGASDSFSDRQQSSYLGNLVDLQLSANESDIMQACCVKDMEVETKELQQIKGKLLLESYQWVLDTAEYKELIDRHSDNARKILWVRGDAGKGKTMLLMGIVQDLTNQQKTHLDEPSLSYFFCRGTDNKLNTALSVLRGLIWMLLRQKRSLIKHFEQDFLDAGRGIFEGSSAFYKLKEIFFAMLQDEGLGRVYLVVDALDECKTDVLLLLDFVVETSANSKVKWILSSRNEDHIFQRLGRLTADCQVSLEVNAESVSQAIAAYIEREVSELSNLHTERFESGHKSDTAKDKLRGILQHAKAELHQKANGTFLWVALVIKELKACDANKIEAYIQEIPGTLLGIYNAMLKPVTEDLSSDFEVYKRVFLTIVAAFRPLHLAELEALAGIDPMSDSKRLIKKCGLFVFKDDTPVVLFVHQSAKDYLVQHYSSFSPDPEQRTAFDILSKFFPAGHSEGHRFIASRSIDHMNILKRDIYDLNDPGASIEQIKAPRSNPLDSLRYPCAFWVDHLESMEASYDQVGLFDNGAVHEFLRLHFLHWLEALSLIQEFHVAGLSIKKLTNLLSSKPPPPESRFVARFFSQFRLSMRASRSQFLPLLQDFHRFILSSRRVIEDYPLQIYSSALVFAPAQSLTRTLFMQEMPRWIAKGPVIESEWNACVHTFPLSPSGGVGFGGTKVALSQEDGSIDVFDIDTGRQIKRMAQPVSRVNIDHIAFLPDGLIVSVSRNGIIQKWDTNSGECVYISEHATGSVTAIAADSSTIVYALSKDFVIKCRDSRDDGCKSLEGHSDRIYCVILSPDGMIASGSDDRTVKFWDPKTQNCLMTFRYSDAVRCLSFSPNGKILAIGLLRGDIETRSSRTGKKINILHGHSDRVTSIGFLSDGTLVSGSADQLIKFWGVNGICLKTFRGHGYGIRSIHISPSDQVISLDWLTVKVWDPRGKVQTFDSHADEICTTCISPRGYAVSVSKNSIKVWDQNGVCLRTLHAYDFPTYAAISEDGYVAGGGFDNRLIRVWNPSGDALRPLMGHREVDKVAFFKDRKLVSYSHNGDFKILDLDGSCLNTIEVDAKWKGYPIYSLQTSPDGNFAAVWKDDAWYLQIWNQDGALLAAPGLPESLDTKRWRQDHILAFSSDGDYLFIASDYGSPEIEVWDVRTGKWLESLDVQEKQDLLQTRSGCPYNDYYISENWVTWKGRNVLWLPKEYLLSDALAPRAFYFTTEGFLIFCTSGRPLAFRVSFDETPFSKHASLPLCEEPEDSTKKSQTDLQDHPWLTPLFRSRLVRTSALIFLLFFIFHRIFGFLSIV